MAKKTAKPAAAVDATAAAAIATAFTAAAESHRVALAALQAVDMSTMGEHEAKQHKAAMLAEKNRMDRNADFARLMNTEKFAAAFLQFGLTVAAVQRLQIYAQDKLAATVQAIAADCALSAVRAGNHSNMMTQRLIAALDATDNALTVASAPKRMHDLHPDKSMGTYSAQASSSRQVLEALGMLDFNAMKKEFSLNERGEAYRHVIAH